jgi:hypothetical protein
MDFGGRQRKPHELNADRDLLAHRTGCAAALAMG